MRFNKKRYLKQGGVRCPYCNSENIEARSSDIMERGEMYQVVDCNRCGGSWEDKYQLTNVRKWG